MTITGDASASSPSGAALGSLLSSDLYPSAEKLAELQSVHGVDDTSRWVEQAIPLALAVASVHGITLTGSINSGANSLVFTGSDDSGQEVVLKVPTPKEAESEINSMIALAGARMPRLIAISSSRDAYVMERIQTVAKSVTALEVRELSREVQRPPVTGVETLETKLERKIGRARHGFYSACSDLHRRQFDVAVETVYSLLTTTSAPVILHGDLHAKNLLRTSSKLMAVDPKPAIGDPSYDLAFYLAWREQDLPVLADWQSVSETRLDQWVWALSVLERKGKDAFPECRESLIEASGEVSMMWRLAP